jgi:hypothetical protein
VLVIQATLDQTLQADSVYQVQLQAQTIISAVLQAGCAG